MYIKTILDFFLGTNSTTTSSTSTTNIHDDFSEKYGDVVLKVAEAVSKFVYDELGKQNIPIKDRLDVSISTLEFSSSVAFGSRFHADKITTLTKEQGDKLGQMKRNQIINVLTVLQKEPKK